MTQRVMIVGSAGQDGRILSDRMRRAGHVVVGLDGRGSEGTALAGLPDTDILDAAAVENAVAHFVPDRVYYLAAFQHAAEEKPGPDVSIWTKSFDVQVFGLIHFLEAIRRRAAHARLFYAATARVFGSSCDGFQDETTAFNPDCPYGISKAAGVQCLRFFRQTHSIFAAAGIMYNHESPFRPPQFVSRKIIRAVTAIKAGLQSKLVLGDLDAVVDWGYAPDYVEAMTQILALPHPDDFIVATGEGHTVREFVEIAFETSGLDWKKYVDVDSRLLSGRRRKMVGDPAKLKAATGWTPSVDFAEMIRLLLQAEEHPCEPKQDLGHGGDLQ